MMATVVLGWAKLTDLDKRFQIKPFSKMVPTDAGMMRDKLDMPKRGKHKRNNKGNWSKA